MDLPTLKLDGTLNTVRSPLHEAGPASDGQPGMYSPRPTQAGNASPGNREDALPSVKKSTLVSPDTVSATRNAYADAAQLGANTTAMTKEGFSRTTGLSSAANDAGGMRNASSSAASASVSFPSGQAMRAYSESLSQAERVESAQRSPSLASLGRVGWRGSVGGTGAVDYCGRQSLWSSKVKQAKVVDAYVMGKRLRPAFGSLGSTQEQADVRGSDDDDSLDDLSSQGNSTWRGQFRQNPSRYVTSMSTCPRGEYVAIGDRIGHVFVMKRRGADPAMGVDNAYRAAADAADDGNWESSVPRGFNSSSVPDCLRAGSSSSDRGRMNRRGCPYRFHVGRQAYNPVIDPLTSVEVTPNVACVHFVPQVGPTTLLLTANEKVPKLYKIMEARESPQAFRAVDMLGAKQIGPLTCADRTSTVAMKQVSRYAMHHEYNINSICALPDGSQFVSADDIAMKLWCVEYPETSLETYTFRPDASEEPKEAIRGCRTFVNEPALLFVSTTAGNVHLIDTRQSLKWQSQVPQTFANPAREADGIFSSVTNSLSDCALSPCGRYIAGRDFMSVCLWDVRKVPPPGSRAGSMGMGGGLYRDYTEQFLSPEYGTGVDSAAMGCGIVQRWELHPSLQDRLDALYQSNVLFERFDIQFIGNSQVCTGGFNGTLFVIDVADSTGEPVKNVSRTLSSPIAATSTIQRLSFKGLDGSSDTQQQIRGPIPLQSYDDSDPEAGMMGFGLLVSRLSRTQLGARPGEFDVLASCGEAVVQLSLSK